MVASTIITHCTSSSSTDPMPDRLQAAAGLGKYFYSSGEELLSCGLPLLTLFTERFFDISFQANDNNSDFFSSLIKKLSEKRPGQKHRLIQYFSSSSMTIYEESPKNRYYATMYTFARLLSDAIADDPSEATDFSELNSLMQFCIRFHQDQMSSILSLDDSCVEECCDHTDHCHELNASSSEESNDDEDLIEKYKKGNQRVIDFFELSSSVLQFNDLELLKKTSFEVGVGLDHFSHTQRFRSTFRNYILVFLAMNNVRCILGTHKKLSKSLPIFKAQASFLKNNLIKIRKMLTLNKTISYASKVELFSHMHRYSNRIFENDDKITLMQERMFCYDALEFYKSVVGSQKSQAIAATNISWDGKYDTEDHYLTLYPPTSSTPVFPEYAEENREVLQNFIPRIREIVKYLSLRCNQIKRDLLICKHAPYFILKGDIQALLARLRAAKGNQTKIDAIIYREMKEFSRRASPATGSSQQTTTSIEPQNEFDQLEELFCSTSKIIKVLFSCQIERAQEWNSYLFDRPLPPPLLRPSRVRLPLTVPSEPQDTPSSSSVPEPSLVETSSSPSNSAPQGLTFYMELEESRRLLQNWVNNLASFRSPMTQSALKNSFEHFDNLLSSLRRLKNLSERETVTQSNLVSFVNDSVRHCTLGVEQLLSALYRETNGIKTKEELAPHLTHDLFQILHKCKMGHGDLPRDVRQWLGEINHGETIVRDIHLHSEEETVLQNLLRASRRVSEAQESSSSIEASHNGEPLFDALFDYLSPLGKLLQTIQDRFPVKRPMAPIRLEGPLTDLIDLFCSQMEQVAVAPSQPLPKTGHYAQLNEIRSLFISQLSTEQRPILDNILENLLVHLETQMQSHDHLEPIEASLHLGNVLLLDQLITEAVLIDSVRSKMIDLSYEEENQHDLFSLVQKLKIEQRFSKEELGFLKMGKTSRQFIRYPASYSKSAPSKGPLSRLDKMLDLLIWGRTLANNQSAREDLRGFTSSNRANAKKLLEVKAFAANDIKLMCSIVKKMMSK